MLKNLMMTLIIGLTFCGCVSAATISVGRPTGTIQPAETMLKIESIHSTQIMPEVHIGDGSRPTIIQTDAEDSALDDEILQDPSKE